MINFLPSFLSSISSFLAILILIFGFVYLYSKGAYFIFFNKLWSFFHRDSFYDRYLDSEREKLLDVERFKVMFGMNRVDDIQTLRDTHKAVKWSDSVAISLRMMGKAGKWVDWKSQTVKKPSLSQKLFLIFFIFVFFVLSVPLSVFSLNSEAVIQFKDSKVWAWQGKQGLRSFFSSDENRWGFDISACSHRDNIKNLPINQVEIDYVCDAVGTGSYFSRLESTVSSQRYFAAPVLIYVVLFLIFLFKELLSCNTAARINRVLHPCHCKK